jgi:hypothetical protein
MSALTKKERDGLDDVFLSIHSNNNKYQKMKELSSLIMSRNLDFSMHTLLTRAKIRLERSKFSHFFTYLTKKKKNLSK